MTNLVLTDKNGTVYNFPESFFLKGHDWGVRSEVREFAYAHGGRDVGDGYLKSRVITIEGAVRADNQATWNAEIDALKAAVLRGGDLTISDDVNARFIKVKSPGAAESYIGDYRLERPITITMIAEEPYWQDVTETTTTKVVAASQEDFNVDASGSTTLVYPVIEVEADQGVDVPSVNLRNFTDGGMLLAYNDPNFVVGDLLIIDCREGTVRRNNNDTIEFLTTPRFLRLQNGVNQIHYEGANCTIRVKFRKVYV